jgi:hypothetical protein
MAATSPFGAVEGGFEFSAEENPFEVVTEAPTAMPVVKAEVTDTLFEDEELATPEPKKVVKKKAPAPKASDDALADIVADWDD